jgi:hypothetical protein
MTARLLSISRTTEKDVYDVMLEIDGRPESMRCQVIEHEGIRAVQPMPDLSWHLPFNPKLLAAAVLAFAQACQTKGTLS